MNHTPSPGAASTLTMLRAQAGLEARMLLRNGEQLLLTIVIPTALLVLLHLVDLADLGGLDELAPGILALAVMSTAFTGLAISTGFERRYGVLKRLGTSPLPRGLLLSAKALAVLAVETLQLALLSSVALALGWRPGGAGWAGAVIFVLLGTAAFAALGLLMAGTLKAEVTLAAANLVYLVLLLAGGVVVPLARFSDVVAGGLRLLPSAALGEGLRSTLQTQHFLWWPVVVLLVWAVLAGALASRTFRWE